MSDSQPSSKRAEPSSKRAEANRSNAQKSTGPRSVLGKERARLNAFKHGMRARTLVLPGEDPDAFHARLDRWTADLQPTDDVERFLVNRAVQLSWQLERADRAIAAGLIEARAAEADRFDELAEEVAILGRRLFWDSRGPTCQYPHFVASIGPRPRVSWSGEIDDPDDPMRLLGRLEATPLGCAWLLDRWGELRDLLEAGDPWQPPDRFKAIRLLGRQPLDIWEDARVMSIYLCCGAIEDSYPHIFRDVMTELDGVEQNRFVERLNARRMTERGPEGAEAGQAELLALNGAEEERLEAALAVHLEHDEAKGILEFDDSDVGERLRRYQASCDRTLLRVLETLRRKHARREAEKSRPRARPEAGTPGEGEFRAAEPAGPARGPAGGHPGGAGGERDERSQRTGAWGPARDKRTQSAGRRGPARDKRTQSAGGGSRVPDERRQRLCRRAPGRAERSQLARPWRTLAELQVAG